jgi:hypothetical protein
LRPQGKIWIGGSRRTIEKRDVREGNGRRVVVGGIDSLVGERGLGVMMAMKIVASFENGVFVPTGRPGLAERERVRLMVERQPQAVGEGAQSAQQPARSPGDLALMLDYHPDGC